MEEVTERDIEHLKELIEKEFGALEKARLLQATEYERRLTELNHEYKRADQALRTYLPREAFEEMVANWSAQAKAEQARIDQRIEMLKLEVQDLWKKLDTEVTSRMGMEKGRDSINKTIAKAVAIIISVITVVVLIANFFSV